MAAWLAAWRRRTPPKATAKSLGGGTDEDPWYVDAEGDAAAGGTTIPHPKRMPKKQSVIKEQLFLPGTTLPIPPPPPAVVISGKGNKRKRAGV